jgi:hypothetical protein
MKTLPPVLQGPLTALTGKPLEGQAPWRLTPMHHVLSSLCSMLIGVVLTCVAISRGGAALAFVIPGWMMSVHGMRNMRMMILHQSAHANLFRRKKLDATIGRAISALLLVENFKHYKYEHIGDHHSSHHMTLLDPTVKALLITLKLRAGMTRRELWHRFLKTITSPLFQARFLVARVQSHMGSASRGEQIATVCFYILFAVTVTVTHAWVLVAVAWLLPLTLFFQISTSVRLIVKHVFPAPGGPRRGKEYFAGLTYGIFLGERVPSAGRSSARRLGAWLRWSFRMAFIHFPARYLVLTGDTVCHDYHHRHPAAKNWPNYLFARQQDIADGHLGWPPYQEVWSLVAAINLVFDSLTVADPHEFDVSTASPGSACEEFAAFDD